MLITVGGFLKLDLDQVMVQMAMTSFCLTAFDSIVADCGPSGPYQIAACCNLTQLVASIKFDIRVPSLTG